MLLNTVKGKMEALLKEKRDAVEKLRLAAQRAMKIYGPYKEFIDFQNVKYVNAKEVVIQKDLENLDASSGEEIKHTMHYLPTDPTWDFQEEEQKPMLNMNTSTIHVPTNIYDKSMTILNGIDWSTNITDQFIANAQEDPNLKWQYFCSSDGVFRLFPGMKWPREPDQVDTFDCRIRKWYIQAASSPKNILILLDTSGSMKGLRFSIARSTVNNILDTLSDEDYFNVMQFSHEARYVDECFNDTLVSASVDNIKRMQEKIALLEAKTFSNFELALTKAFKLFKKEQLEYHGHNLCNKAIMIITDGAPENFDSVFDKYNWPEKSIRVFTFLIGKEVPDNRQTRWMACANKGIFTHISTRADVQENVQKYIKVLSRPLALQKISQEVWSPVYIDYTTDQADIVIPAGRTADLHMDFEMDSVYEGLGLVMTVSMAVLDERPEVGPNEESPERNILGVVGTDLRINELMRFIPTFELGVNGYAFGITNHGYILFHPDYRPFYGDNWVGTKQYLKVKPKYNSVDLSEVELTTSNASGWNKEHPLRKYLLMSRSGGYNMSLNSVLTHSDGMKRAKERRNHYQFKEIVDTFKLVFVVPDNYGTRFIQVDPKSVPNREKVIELMDATLSQIDLSKWLYCVDGKSTSMSQLDVEKFYLYLNEGTLEQKCGKELTQRLLVDLNLTVMYARVWEGTHSKYVRTSRFNKFVKDYESCWDVPGATEEQSIEKKKCIIKQHMSNGIGKIWIGTSSGLTRYLDINGLDMEAFVLKTQTIKSLYYRRAVDGWEEGYKFVFTGPVVTSQKEFNFNTSVVTMSTAEIVGNRPMQVPAAVVAFSMSYSAFYEKFLQYTFNSSYSYSCNDTEDIAVNISIIQLIVDFLETLRSVVCHCFLSDRFTYLHFYCYLIDNNGYILATNNPDRNGTGLLLGQHNERIMSALLDDNIFKQLKLTDYQSMCETPIFGTPDSSSSFIINPLKLLARGIFWLVSEIVLLLSEWSVFGNLRSALASGYELVVGTSVENNQCAGWIPEEVVRYLCGFVIDANTGQKLVVNYIKSKYSCVQTITRYTLNLNVLTSRPKRFQMADCLTQCASKHKISYEARWLNDTNLVFVVVDASCVCNYSQSGEGDGSLANNTNRMIFTVLPKEVKHDDNTQCQILLNFSEELKLVDDTRTHNTICLDSTNETDTPCSQSTALTCSHVTSLTSFTLTVLLIFTFMSSH